MCFYAIQGSRLTDKMMPALSCLYKEVVVDEDACFVRDQHAM